jgi:hypothetical protein
MAKLRESRMHHHHHSMWLLSSTTSMNMVIIGVWWCHCLCWMGSEAMVVTMTTTTPYGFQYGNRRDLIFQGSSMAAAAASVTLFLHPPPATAATDIPTPNNKNNNNNDDDYNYNRAMSLLDAKQIDWSSSYDKLLSRPNTLWNSSRYRSSTLSDTTAATMVAAGKDDVTKYPQWMEGYWSVQYRFQGASFPQGKQILSLRTAGAGLGTCLSLPNVGYNPPAPHAAHYISNGVVVHEDIAYNIPRKLETFWPQCKVFSIQTDGGGDDKTLSSKCFVTGEGCTKNENPQLHDRTSRYSMDFEAPTRRSGQMTQSWDVTLVQPDSTNKSNNNYYGLSSSSSSLFSACQTYSQYNVQQDLQTFYKEIISLHQLSDNSVLGKIRVAAFLPNYIKSLDNTQNNGKANIEVEYDENKAVVIYDYKVLMERIDENQASSI